MLKSIAPRTGVVLLIGVLAACGRVSAVGVQVPPAQVDETLAPTSRTGVAVVAGGCFWGVQAVFQHTRGVVRATSGYAGGTADTAVYETVSSGETNHAES